MASSLDGLTASGTYGTQSEYDDNDQKPPVAHSPENALLRQLLHEEAVVPLERAVSAALKPLIGHVQDTNCHLQELFALGPMVRLNSMSRTIIHQSEQLQTVPSDVPICNERLAQLLAEAFAEPSESSNVQRAILNPDESVTESEASDGEDVSVSLEYLFFAHDTSSAINSTPCYDFSAFPRRVAPSNGHSSDLPCSPS